MFNNHSDVHLLEELFDDSPENDSPCTWFQLPLCVALSIERIWEQVMADNGCYDDTYQPDRQASMDEALKL